MVSEENGKSYQCSSLSIKSLNSQIHKWFPISLHAMKKKNLLPIAVAVLLLTACNNNNQHGDHARGAEPKTTVDSLLKDIDDIHIVGMSKMGQLNTWQQKAQRFIDSLSKLPAKAKAETESLRAKADSLLSELNYADYAMNTWMPEFYSHADTLADKVDLRLNYLRTEKEKAEKVTAAIVEGIRKADSLFRATP